MYFACHRLKEYCEKLMFYNPADYGRKAEEVLWRKVFYDIIQVVKHNRKVSSVVGECCYNNQQNLLIPYRC